jgi:spore germination protein YaaH
METSAKPADSTATITGNSDDLYNFTLAERYVLLSEEELERYIDQEAEAEVSSSAYEGIPLDKERIKAGLRELYRELRVQATLKGASAAA